MKGWEAELAVFSWQLSVREEFRRGRAYGRRLKLEFEPESARARMEIAGGKLEWGGGIGLRPESET